MLSDLVDESFISINAEAADWQEAVILSGQLLLQNGCVTETYVQAMVDTVKEFGPYVVIGPGLALAHARPEFGVSRAGFSFVTLKEPVYFGNPDNDPVRLVIGLCAPDNAGHLDAIAELAVALNKENMIEKICECKTADEMLNLLKDN